MWPMTAVWEEERACANSALQVWDFTPVLTEEVARQSTFVLTKELTIAVISLTDSLCSFSLGHE